MKKIFLFTVIISLIACTPVKNKPNEKSEFYMGGFDGVWIGDLKAVQSNGYPFFTSSGSDLSIMLTIRQGKVSVLAGRKGNLSQVKGGKFKIIEHKTKAIIYAQDSGSDVDDTPDIEDWVETWNFTITHKESDSIYMYFVRSVNNIQLEHNINTDKETGRFFYSYSGELGKVASIERVNSLSKKK